MILQTTFLSLTIFYHKKLFIFFADFDNLRYITSRRIAMMRNNEAVRDIFYEKTNIILKIHRRDVGADGLCCRVYG